MMRAPSCLSSPASMLAAIVLAAAGLGAGPVATPAHAQLTVFDPSNYSQNILTAARSLSQINNQIQSLQNEATMILYQARNLSRIGFPQLQAVTQAMQQIDRLMDQAQGIKLRAATVDQQFRQLFPGSANAATTGGQQAVAARARLDASLDGFRHALTIQAQIAENVAADAQTLTDVVARSQGAEGALQVGQASNQLLALVTKQQLQLQQLMAAQFRAQSVEQARRVQAEAEAQVATRRFLGTGRAYALQRAGVRAD